MLDSNERFRPDFVEKVLKHVTDDKYVLETSVRRIPIIVTGITYVTRYGTGAIQASRSWIAVRQQTRYKVLLWKNSLNIRLIRSGAKTLETVYEIHVSSSSVVAVWFVMASHL